MSDQIDARTDVAAFGGTVFISYARADDERPPFDDTVHGWVTFFWQQLRFELTNAGLPQAELWLDRYEIEPAEDFTRELERAIQDAKLFLIVSSPNWIQRPWCLKEVTYFAELHSDAADKALIVKKLELPTSVKLPHKVNQIFENREGYRFFEKDITGNIREFYWRGLQDQRAYYGILLKIARWIAERMISNEEPRSRSPRPLLKGKAIYVAAPADDLRDAWQRLANDLEKDGYEVFPAAGRLPDTAQMAETSVRDGLSQAVLSIHLLGDSEGVKPDGSEETAARLQLRLARERAVGDPAFTRILWAPKWLPDRSKGQRDPFEVVQRFGPLLPGEEVFAEEVTDLSQWLRGKLDRENEGARVESPANIGPLPPIGSLPPAARVLLVASADPEDDESVTRLANRLQSPEIRVQVACSGDRPGTGPSVAIILWDKADDSNISTLLTELEPLKPIVLWLPGQGEPKKRRFFREGIYSERLETLPADRRAGRDLLIRLEILPSNGINGK